jgi:RNA polymerase subunit RPABC4/transcription elongation factor Spt4
MGKNSKNGSLIGDKDKTVCPNCHEADATPSCFLVGF